MSCSTSGNGSRKRIKKFKTKRLKDENLVHIIIKFSTRADKNQSQPVKIYFYYFNFKSNPAIGSAF